MIALYSQKAESVAVDKTHKAIFYNLLCNLKGENVIALDSQQRGLQFLHPW